MADPIKIQVDIQSRPMKNGLPLTLYIADLRDGGIQKPREILKGQEYFPLFSFIEEPESVRRDVGDFNSRSAGARNG